MHCFQACVFLLKPWVFQSKSGCLWKRAAQQQRGMSPFSCHCDDTPCSPHCHTGCGSSRLQDLRTEVFYPDNHMCLACWFSAPPTASRWQVQTVGDALSPSHVPILTALISLPTCPPPLCFPQFSGVKSELKSLFLFHPHSNKNCVCQWPSVFNMCVALDLITRTGKKGEGKEAAEGRGFCSQCNY